MGQAVAELGLFSADQEAGLAARDIAAHGLLMLRAAVEVVLKTELRLELLRAGAAAAAVVAGSARGSEILDQTARDGAVLSQVLRRALVCMSQFPWSSLSQLDAGGDDNRCGGWLEMCALAAVHSVLKLCRVLASSVVVRRAATVNIPTHSRHAHHSYTSSPHPLLPLGCRQCGQCAGDIGGGRQRSIAVGRFAGQVVGPWRRLRRRCR
jgi:hypothetical protein